MDSLAPEPKMGISEFSELLRSTDAPQRSEIVAFLKGKKNNEWPKFLVAAMEVDPSFCHLFPRLADATCRWDYADIAQALSQAFEGAQQSLQNDDRIAWANWLCEWLSAHHDQYSVRLENESLDTIAHAVLTNEDIVQGFWQRPSKLVNAWKFSPTIHDRLAADDISAVLKRHLENFMSDYNGVGLLLKWLTGDQRRMLDISAQVWRGWLVQWFQTKIKHGRDESDDVFADLALGIFGKRRIHVLIDQMQVHELANVLGNLKHSPLMHCLAAQAPDRIALGLREVWKRYQADHLKERWATCRGIANVIQSTGAIPLIKEILLLGFSLGVIASEEKIDLNSPQFWQDQIFFTLTINEVQELPEPIVLQAKLWFLLRSLAVYIENQWSHRTEILGVSSEIATFAAEHPETWALALPWILERSDLLNGTAESVTTLLTNQFDSVANALNELCVAREISKVRDRALGISAILRGIESPGPELVRQIMDVVTTWIDARQVFPHPLELPSSTWLGSLGIEGTFRAAVQNAERNFKDFFRSVAGLDEDIHTSRLLDELARALKSANLDIRGLARSPSTTPLVSLESRQAPKRSEEPKYGLDLALIMSCSIPEKIAFDLAELIQVKKLRRRKDLGSFSESWSIDTRQLEKLVSISASSAYWLFDERGNVLVVPSKLLWGIAGARSHRGAAMTISHHEVRSMAIPLAQFFADLLVGAWVGNPGERVLKIARGEDRLIQPRLMAEFRIRWSQE